MLNERLEEIIEATWSAGERKKFHSDDIRKRCSVEFTDNDLETLEKMGLIVRSGEKIVFSSNGKVVARGVMRRHRLAEVLLSSILKLKNGDIEEMACKLEHCLHHEVEESICTLLGHPEICPDGKPIPRGKCCEENLKVINNTIVSLVELEPSESGKITYILPGSHSNLHQLISIGLQPGIVVTVHRKTPAFCIKFENTELALDREIAENIYLWRLNGSTPLSAGGDG